jgi:hypothetical protein
LVAVGEEVVHGIPSKVGAGRIASSVG